MKKQEIAEAALRTAFPTAAVEAVIKPDFDVMVLRIVFGAPLKSLSMQIQLNGIEPEFEGILRETICAMKREYEKYVGGGKTGGFTPRQGFRSRAPYTTPQKG